MVRLPVKDTAQRNTWECLWTHHKTGQAMLVKSMGWKTVVIRMTVGRRRVQEGAEQHFYTPEIHNPDSDGFINSFQAGRLCLLGPREHYYQHSFGFPHVIFLPLE